MSNLRRRASFLVPLLASLVATPLLADGWPSWRGPQQNGVADAKGLISTWSKEGENLIWRVAFTGRSTPVVLEGRVCAQGRIGEGDRRQELVACFDAGTGKQLWERRFNVVNTDVPWNRVGWPSPVADRETGNVYAQLVDGTLVALGRDGATVWQWNLTEDMGRFGGYGGRTNTPIIDGDRLVVHLINAGFGSARGPADRLYAFDKRDGKVLWISPKGETPQDLNTYSVPVVAEIAGRRQVIYGGSDGYIHAYDVHTGEELWRFQLSLRGLNASVVARDGVVFASHSEENPGEPTMGRLVAIDASGRGDVTKTHEKWRVDEIGAGYASPAIDGGRLYVVDNSANLYAFDAQTGATLWHDSLGTVGKGSPVVADGKIYVTEVNGNFLILKPSEQGVTKLAEVHLTMPAEDRYAEVYGSPAIAYGRIYFASEEGLYCLGDPKARFHAADGLMPAPEAKAPAGAVAATIRVVPGVVTGRAGTPTHFEARAFDAQGRAIGPVAATWSLEGLPGQISADGHLTTDAAAFKGTRVGTVKATIDVAGKAVTATADLRLAGPPPWGEDFEGIEVGKVPPGWLGTGKKASVVEKDGGKVLLQPDPQRGAPRATMWIGPSGLSSATLTADVHGSQQGRRRPDVGLINQGYTFDLQGNHQRIQITSWGAERRPIVQLPYEWSMDRWYRMKLFVEVVKDAAGVESTVAYGKVWPRDEPEPADWTITLHDPLVISSGAPALYAFSPVDAFFDNVQLTVKQ